MKSKSFTLIELLVVIVVIGILAGVIMISTSSSIDKASFAKAHSFSSTVQNELLLNLVSEWTFDNASNIGEDTWGNNNGTPIGNTSLESNDCVFGTCAKFDGSGDYIDCGNDSSLNPLYEITLSYWINVKSKAGVAIAGENLTPYYSYIGGNVANPSFKIFTSGGSKEVYAGEMSDNTWHHVVGFYNGTDIRIYVDGILKNQEPLTGTINSSLNRLYIGSRNATDLTSLYFNGSLDDVRIYNKALLQAEIKQNYIAGLNSLFAGGNISKKEYNERIDQLSIK